MIDGKVTDNEIYSLNDWLLEYENFNDHWPFCEVCNLVSKILEDDQIDQKPFYRIEGRVSHQAASIRFSLFRSTFFLAFHKSYWS
jgi:hypothetical protein